MESANIDEMEKPRRRSKILKNLEEEVNLIFSQDENDESDADINVKERMPSTPSRSNTSKHVTTPKASKAVLDYHQTPRRSCRKSVKPAQEYEDIVNKSLRFTRSARKNLETMEEDKENENLESEIEQHKWTPAEVGRVSQKRRRKLKKGAKGKKHDDTETRELFNETIYDVECGETKKNEDEILENKENVEEIVGEDGDQVEIKIKQIKVEDNIVEAKTEVQVENLNRTFDRYEMQEILEHKDTDQIDSDTTRMKFIDNMEEVKDNSISIAAAVQAKNLKQIEKDSSIIHHKEENKIKENQEQEEKDEMDSDSIHLIQEDSEDCNKFSEKSEQEEICIIYESNISNRETNERRTSSPKRSVQNKKDSFGSYLKSNDINISELGLNPLKDEEEEKDVYCSKSIIDEPEEMPSLIICDDETQNMESNKLNTTFETNESDMKRNEDNMEVLQLSDDDCERPKKRVRIALVDDTTPKGSTSKTKLSLTHNSTASKLSVTPKQSSKPFRFPTPYRSKKTFKFDEVKENTKTTPKCPSKASKIFITTLEPKEIILRGIRKRSLSVCIETGNQNRTKHERMVSFYSPANETAIIDDIDILIASSVKKPKPQERSNKYVTTRRKRSISLDESSMSTSLASKLPRPVPGQSTAAKSQTFSKSKTETRTKLPNFAAIHEKQFKKMENLVEHVNRKQERSKNLINSTIKLKPASAQKSGSVVKNSNNIPPAMSKAAKKIDLMQIKSLNTTAATAQVSEVKKTINLPTSKLGATKLLKPGSTSRKPPNHEQQSNKYLKPSQTSNIEKTQSNVKTAPTKPTFNLSTSLMPKPMASSSHAKETANISHMSHDDKMASRLQRHMDLFKGRAPSTRQTGAATRKNEVILKGVRSNRRFELQMKHRKNLEQ